MNGRRSRKITYATKFMQKWCWAKGGAVLAFIYHRQGISRV